MLNINIIWQTMHIESIQECYNDCRRSLSASSSQLECMECSEQNKSQKPYLNVPQYTERRVQRMSRCFPKTDKYTTEPSSSWICTTETFHWLNVYFEGMCIHNSTWSSTQRVTKKKLNRVPQLVVVWVESNISIALNGMKWFSIQRTQQQYPQKHCTRAFCMRFLCVFRKHVVFLHPHPEIEREARSRLSWCWLLLVLLPACLIVLSFSYFNVFTVVVHASKFRRFDGPRSLFLTLTQRVSQSVES